MENTVLTLFGQPLTVFGLGCALALLIGLLFCFPVFRRSGLSYGAWIRFGLCIIPLSWFFSRLFYVFADWVMIPLEALFDLNTGRSLVSGLYFWNGGYSLVGALAGAVLGAVLAEKWLKASRGSLRDALAFGLPAAIFIERLFEQGTGLGLGRYVTSEWLISTGILPNLDGDPVHPVYLYEAAAALVLLLVMLHLFRRCSFPPGDLLRRFLLFWGLTQVVMESLRADGHLVEHFVHVQQVYAVFLAVIVLLRWSIVYKRQNRPTAHIVISWCVTITAAGTAVLAEFGVDRWGNLLLAYGLMIVCLLAIGAVTMWLRPKSPEN